MDNFQKEYYEQTNLCDKNFAKIAAEQERLKEIINIIPSDVNSLLDVGCGNGFIVNFLKKIDKYKKLVGLDISSVALKSVKTEKVQGSVENIPFKDKSFDLVMCLEVLEHLSEKNFQKGISELQRVSKKYILITVPNKESLERSLVVCQKCHCWFNPSLHMRSFDNKIMEKLFQDFTLTESKEIGPISRVDTYPLLLLYPYYSIRKATPPQIAICPQCGYQAKKQKANISTYKKTNNIIKIFYPIKTLFKFIFWSTYKKRWLLALYKKNE